MIKVTFRSASPEQELIFVCQKARVVRTMRRAQPGAPEVPVSRVVMTFDDPVQVARAESFGLTVGILGSTTLDCAPDETGWTVDGVTYRVVEMWS